MNGKAATSGFSSVWCKRQLFEHRRSHQLQLMQYLGIFNNPENSLSQLAQKLADYETYFKQHRALINRFSIAAVKFFNREFFPSSNFTSIVDGHGQLNALGMSYELEFHFVILENMPTTILEVSLPAKVHRAKETLALWHVDESGNVRSNSNQEFGPNTIDDKSFMLEIADTTLQAYFALAQKEMPLGKP